MKKLYIRLICTAAVIAALGLSGCSNMSSGKQTNERDVEVVRQQTENCPDGDCDDGDKGGECPDGKRPDGDCDDGDKNGERSDGKCPDGDCDDGDKGGKCPDGKRPDKGRKGKKGKKGIHGKPVLPKGRLGNHRKKPALPKLPVKPPEDDVILPDPPIEKPHN